MDKVWIAVTVAPPGTGDASHFHGAFSTRDKAMDAVDAQGVIEEGGALRMEDDGSELTVVLDDRGNPYALVFPSVIDVPQLEPMV